MSLAADFGIDDSSGTAYGGNPYGTTSGASYGDVSSMLDDLGLTYGLDGGELGRRRGHGLRCKKARDWNDMQSMSWGDLDEPDGGGAQNAVDVGPNLIRSPKATRASAPTGRRGGPRRPAQAKGSRLQQQQSPRARNL